MCRDVIEQIRKLNYVNNDIGRGRAWIRITLNEMSLVSYLENMLKNPSYVRSFYKPSAFLRDSEKCDILKNYLIGIVESCKFELVVDNSLLNNWTSGPLSLVGLWMDDNISQGIDVAQNMDYKDLQTIPQLGKKSPIPEFITALGRQPLLAEEDALRIIIASKPSSSNAASAASSRRNSSDSSQFVKEPVFTVAAANQNYCTKFGSDKIVESSEPKDQPPESVITTIPKDKNKVPQSKVVVAIASQPTPEDYVKQVGNETHNTNQPVTEPMDIVPVGRDTQIQDNSDSITNNSEELSYMELLAAYNKDKKIGAEIYGGSPMESHLEELMKNQTTNSDNDRVSEKATSSVEVF